jgi:hypothetical protein
VEVVFSTFFLCLTSIAKAQFSMIHENKANANCCSFCKEAKKKKKKLNKKGKTMGNVNLCL